MVQALSSSMMAALLLAAPSTYAAANTRMTLETGVEYYTGKYGTNHPTDILYMPLTCKVQDKDWAVRFTVPYLEVTGASNVVARLGPTVTAVTHTHVVRAGWGDLLVAASHNIVDGGNSGVSVKLSGKVKFATANTGSGLSSGANDYAVESTLFYPTSTFTTFGTLGYKVYGSPATYRLENVFYGTVGGNYRFSPETSGGAMLFAGQRIMASRANRAEVLFFSNHTLGGNWKAQGYLLKGLTSSVPAWGGGILLDYAFDLKEIYKLTHFNLRGFGEG